MNSSAIFSFRTNQNRSGPSRLDGARRGARRCRRLGAAVVEFAVTVPVMSLFVFGLCEVGQGLLVKQVLCNAARDGARSASLEGSTVEQVEDSVIKFLAGSAINGTTVKVTPNPLSLAQGGDPVSVTVSVPFSSISWLSNPFYLKGATLDSTVVMRREVFVSNSEIEDSE